MYWYLTCN